ncbi:MAG: NAD-dependent deacylase [Phycisphaeraceae bacterium]|nr:NAD-dependent deacylase [Phycisphaeraceae bacterium]
MPSGIDETALRAAAEALAGARSVVALTGAGVSAESGIPTFRDAMTGLWAKFDAQRLATPDAFERDPALVSRWYDERRMRCARCVPNAGHSALASIERVITARGRSFTLLTQNVDRLHLRAGSERVIELHGSLFAWRCTVTGTKRDDLPMPLPNYPLQSEAGGIYRPGVVWFGEELPAGAVRRAARAVESCDLFLSIGTSGVVYPAAGFIESAAGVGARIIEINPEPTPLSHLATWRFAAPSGELLPHLFESASFT